MAAHTLTQVHKIDDSNHSMTVTYTLDEDTPEKTVTFSVPNGTYTSQELADEIEDAILAHEDAGPDGLYMEFTERNTFNLNLEGGQKLGDISGGLSYLLYESYQGGSGGILIGTTIFTSDTATLKITPGKNDAMSFIIEDLDGQKTPVDLTLAGGRYTRSQLIDKLNEILETKGTTVRASEYGTGIQMGSDEEIVSQFKGNMFTIDGRDYTSVFYDNVYHGAVEFSPGVFTGGNVILTGTSTNARDLEHQYFEIVTGVNDTLTFQPNTTETPVTITIAEGKYTLPQMVSKLNELFTDSGSPLELIASQTPAEGAFAGIRITSKEKGVNSKVGIDPGSSSAYDTLFVERRYNVYTNDAVLTNDRKKNEYAYFTGAKSYDESSTNYNNLPLTVQAGVDDKFALNINGTAYTVTIAPGNYTTCDAVFHAINQALSTELGEYNGKIQAERVVNRENDCIRLRAVNYSDQITKLTAGELPGNGGYANLFTTSVVLSYRTQTGTDTTPTSLGTFPEPATISEPNHILTISSKGQSGEKTVSNQLDLRGEYPDHQALIDKINNDSNNVTRTETFNIEANIPKRTGYAQNATVSSRTTQNGTNATPASSVRQNYFSPTATPGVTQGGQEGSTGDISVNKGASYAFSLYNSEFLVDDSCNTVKLNINGSDKTITFENGSYSPGTFASKLNAKLGSEATVSCSGNRVTITCNITDANPYGDATSVNVNLNDSSLLQKADSKITAASEGSKARSTSQSAMSLPIEIQDNESFSFSVDGSTKSVSLVNGTYTTASGFAQMLSNQLAAYGVEALATGYNGEGTGNYLSLQKTTVGSGSVSFTSGSTAIFGSSLHTDASVSSTSDKALQSEIVIESGKQNFQYYGPSGNKETAVLDEGKYSPDQFVQQLNSKLNGVTASLAPGNRLVLSANGTGNNSVTVGMDYDSGDGSAMQAIWGTYEKTVPKVIASFGGEDGNELQLKSAETGEQMSFVIRAQGVVQPKKTYDDFGSYVNKYDGYYNDTPASLDGVDLSISAAKPLVIDEWNDDLKFAWYKCDNEQNILSRNLVSVQVAQGNYTSYAQLQNELQSKLDSAAGAGELQVTVDEHGVRIEAVVPGNSRAIMDPVKITAVSGNLPYSYTNYRDNFGDFYDKVMCTCREEQVDLVPSNKDGSNFAAEDKVAYTIGRKDVKNNTTKIVKDVNDDLSLDFSYKKAGGSTQSYTFHMKLDPGTYSGDQIVEMIQKKLDEELETNHLEPGTIEVAIGKIHNDVAGSNNDNALNFILSDKTKLPGEGEYVIDGIGGNAAFSVFYQTEGELVPAYVYGVKDITDGVTIEDGRNTFSFRTDQTDYEIEIPPGDYTADEIINKLNELLKAESAPVKAELDENGRLKLSQKKMGKHPIDSIGGPARSTLMFNEYSDDKEDASIYVKPSAEDTDRVTIDRRNMSTAALGINTIGISKDKYSNKALGRLKDALHKVSQMRAYYGAMQNRLEHLINNNQVAVENTTAADSRLADTDMAKESVALALANLREQAGQTILAQANKSNQTVLSLLNG